MRHYKSSKQHAKVMLIIKGLKPYQAEYYLSNLQKSHPPMRRMKIIIKPQVKVIKK